jgi:hypothetical protein
MVATRPPSKDRTHPFSSCTNLANEVNEHLVDARLSSRAMEFCLYFQRHTFGKASWHRKPGRPEWGCQFDLARWAKALKLDKSNLRRTRHRLEACHIIHFDPDPAHPGQGWLGWQLPFDGWLPYDGRRTR